MRRYRTDLAALIGALAAVALFVALGVDAGARDAFGLMGFDADRAALLTAGLGAVLAGATAGVISAHRLPAVISASLALWALFASTFVAETLRAATSPVLGRFDPGGWAETAAVLTGTSVLIGLAMGILGAHLRSGAVELVHGLNQAWSGRTPRAIPRARLLIALLLLAMVVVGTPVLGQILNIGPDALMFSGGAAGVPIVGGSSMSDLPTPSQGSTPSPGLSGSAGPTPSPTQGTIYPWVAWRPHGSGSVLELTLPAPWNGGSSRVVHFSVYLPPQYASGTRRYPVEYEMPTPLTLFESATAVRPTLDRLIDAGQIPASVFVFVSTVGGPFVDSECIDASGGSEWFDTFVARTLVPFIDANFRTIARASARTLLGFSQGGFCAANVLLHHPSLFHQSVSFSGYFYAAPLIGVAASARAAYAGNRSLELANSPMLIANDLPTSLRGSIMFTLAGDRSTNLLGRQLNQFAALATDLGYGVTVLDTPLGHSWLAVRALLPSALVAVAMRQAEEGVF
jgi:hypothetical protein